MGVQQMPKARCFARKRQCAKISVPSLSALHTALGHYYGTVVSSSHTYNCVVSLLSRDIGVPYPAATVRTVPPPEPLPPPATQSVILSHAYSFVPWCWAPRYSCMPFRDRSQVSLAAVLRCVVACLLKRGMFQSL